MSPETLPHPLTIWDKYPQLREIETQGKFPHHLLLIPDGNGRWANQVLREKPIEGHKAGAENILNLLRSLRELPIDIVTLWAFASDNWNRPKDEVDGLMSLLELLVEYNLDELKESNVIFKHLGRKDRLPESLRNALEKAERETSKNTGQTLCLAVDYGGEDQNLRTHQKVADMARANPHLEITQGLVTSIRDGQGDIPPADLIIRTSGEERISDLGWLATNSEFSTIQSLLPEVTIDEVIEALIDFARRERRFGGRPYENKP